MASSNFLCILFRPWGHENIPKGPKNNQSLQSPPPPPTHTLGGPARLYNNAVLYPQPNVACQRLNAGV